MYQHTQQSGDEHSEAAAQCHPAGILLEAFGTESEASCSYYLQAPFVHGFLGDVPLPTQTRRAEQTSAPSETGGVVGHLATSVARL